MLDKILPNVLPNIRTINEFEILLVVALKEIQSVILPFSIGGDSLYTVKPKWVINVRYGITTRNVFKVDWKG